MVMSKIFYRISNNISRDNIRNKSVNLFIISAPFDLTLGILNPNNHCVKSVQIRSCFWSVFSCIRTEYGDLFRKSPYLVRIQENVDQKNFRIWTLVRKWVCQ